MNKQELQSIRINTAIEMCILRPHLAIMLFEKNPLPKNAEEDIRFKILIELTKLEPCIKHILEYYIKRNS